MSGLRLLPLGVGDAFSRLSYSTCLALEAQGSWLLIDCPHPIRKMMHDAGISAAVELDVGSISAVAVTHLHADHVCGLEDFGFFSCYGLKKSARLLAHPSVSEHLWHGHLAASMEWAIPGPGQAPVQRHFEDYFALQALCETTPVMIGPFAVTCHATVHSLPTTAMFVEAGGRRFAYSSDTIFDPKLIEWMSRADLIIHEAGEFHMHTRYADLAALPAELRAKMRVVHCPDGFDPPGREVELLEQGRMYEV